MADLKSVSFAAAVHIVLRLSLFLECSNCLYNLWYFPSFLVFASVCMVLVDVGVLPDRYKRNFGFHLILEAILALFIMEVVMVIIWAKFEVFAEIFLKSSLKNLFEEGTDFVTNFTVSSFSIALFLYVTSVTNNWNLAKQELKRFKAFVQAYFKKGSNHDIRINSRSTCENQNLNQSNGNQIAVPNSLTTKGQRNNSAKSYQEHEQPQGFLTVLLNPLPMCPQVDDITSRPLPPRAKKQPKQKKSR